MTVKSTKYIVYIYFTTHETLGTASSPDATDGVPRVTCRFGKVVCNIISLFFQCRLTL